MPFVYEGRAAVDRERSIEISRAFKFEDADDFFRFKFTNADLSFTFYAKIYSERRRFLEEGKETERAVPIWCEIFEPSVRQGLAQAGEKSLSAEQYQAIKADIRDGMYVLGAARNKDGSQIVPDYRVGFAERVSAARSKY